MGSIIVFIALGVIFYYFFKNSVQFQKRTGPNQGGPNHNRRDQRGNNFGGRRHHDRASWSQSGPLGALLDMIFNSNTENNGRQSGQSTRQLNFHYSLLILAAYVMKADGKVLRSELNYVKTFLVQNFGERRALEMVQSLKEILKHNYDYRNIARQIGLNMDYHSRLQLMQFLFNIASSDGDCSYKETSLLKDISSGLLLNRGDFESLHTMFVGNAKDDPYKVLEIDSSISNVELKKAYHKMAMKYHPDKVSHLGEDIKKSAEVKFQRLNSAYELIKKDRGLK
ncbi:MAG: TerB family tellurite resistance protein [Bacteroidales bacterium]